VRSVVPPDAYDLARSRDAGSQASTLWDLREAIALAGYEFGQAATPVTTEKYFAQVFAEDSEVEVRSVMSHHARSLRAFWAEAKEPHERSP
jgi:hypothetical protein